MLVFRRFYWCFGGHAHRPLPTCVRSKKENADGMPLHGSGCRVGIGIRLRCLCRRLFVSIDLVLAFDIANAVLGVLTITVKPTVLIGVRRCHDALPYGHLPTLIALWRKQPMCRGNRCVSDPRRQRA